MKILLILLLISIPCMADKSFFKPNPVDSEYVLYMPDLAKKFNEIINSKDKCSLESYRKMEQIIGEVYIWLHFQKSVDALQMLNTMTQKIESEGEKKQYIYSIEDVLDDGDEVTQDEVLKNLNDWRVRECTYMGKGKALWHSLRSLRSQSL